MKGIRKSFNFKLNNKGVTLVEIAIVLMILAVVVAGVYTAGPKMMDKTKTSNLRREFASLETCIIQMFYERDGLTNTNSGSDKAEFASIFNKYVDSNAELSDTGELKLKDPWGTAYKVSYTKKSGSDASVLVQSMGKLETIPSHALLVHYKEGEVRAGTSGFDNDKGIDTSDAAFSEASGATITTLWK